MNVSNKTWIGGDLKHLWLRGEIRRELATYVGVAWTRKFYGTADFAREDGERAGRARLTFGLGAWF